MNWSDVTKGPPRNTLRQFAALWLVFFCSLAAWRAWHGQRGASTLAIAVLAALGSVGLLRPGAMRWISVGWMTVAFPIGWTVSRAMLAALFYLVFTPLALVFRLMDRDALRVRRVQAETYWTARVRAVDTNEYFRQS